MKSISQVAQLTGVSIRTLQYYDEIGLLKPSALTESGYRLYDDDALRPLQQILFFKELGFQLKEIDEILKDPDFDRIAAFRKQKELFLLKRRRMDRLIQLLDRLEKGEQDMSFKEFDLTDYLSALENFKTSQTETVIKPNVITLSLIRSTISNIAFDFLISINTPGCLLSLLILFSSSQNLSDALTFSLLKSLIYSLIRCSI